MHIVTFPLGQLQTNCYLIIKEKTALVVDPADSADFILEEIQRRNLQLQGIVATHGHFDHIMAVGEIQLSYPQFPLYMHSEDLFLAKRLKETAAYFLNYEPTVIPIQTFTELTQGAHSIGNFSFEVIHTPGHTPGSCSLYFRDEGVVFSGDTLFSGSVGRYDFKYSDKKDLTRSVEKLLTLPEETTVYSGHGEKTLVQLENMKGTITLLQ